MSAAGRGPRGGQGRDFYATPAWCTRALVKALGDSVDRAKWWFEPACGDGAIEKVLSEEFGVEKVIATDIAPGPRYAGQFDYVHELDYIAGPPKLPGGRFEVAITNPPYSLAFEFVSRMVLEARVAVALLPLSFLASKERKVWLESHPPNLYALTERPSFAESWNCIGDGTQKEDGCGWHVQTEPGVKPELGRVGRRRACPQCGGKVARVTTDATDFAWFVWGLPAQPIQFLCKEGNT